MAVFVVFSGLGGLASDGWLLIVARFVTGVAAGFMAPAGLSIITTSYAEGPARNRALLIYAGTAAAGFSLGKVAGGVLTEVGWRWVVFAPVVLATALLVLALKVVPHDEDDVASGGFDLAGALAPIAAMLLLDFTVVRAPDADTLLTAAGFAGSAALVAAFAAIERRASAPLVRLGILRSPALLRADAGTLLSSSARSSPSSSSPSSTCRSCAAGRGSRRAWRWRARATHYSCGSAPTGPTSTCCRR